MRAEPIKTIITQADLLRLDAEEKWAEVDDGELIESENNVPLIHVIIVQNLYLLLTLYLQTNPLGRVFTDGARYILKGTPQMVIKARKPDFSFVAKERIPADFDWSGDFVFAPDLAVEVASPGQTNAIFARRIADYFEAGTREVWIIYPWHKTLYQYQRDGEAPRVYHLEDEVDTVDLFPGLRLMMSAIFSTEAL